MVSFELCPQSCPQFCPLFVCHFVHIFVLNFFLYFRRLYLIEKWLTNKQGRHVSNTSSKHGKSAEPFFLTNSVYRKSVITSLKSRLKIEERKFSTVFLFRDFNAHSRFRGSCVGLLQCRIVVKYFLSGHLGCLYWPQRAF